MEEKQEISTEVFNQIHRLSREDFLNFDQIVSEQDFKDLKIQFNMLDSHKTRVLNIMIYYIISIQENFNPFPEDNCADKYRTLCANQISDYYIKNKFNIEEYEFSYLASKALSKTIQECAHIIYYLIYGRFASHPYINSLCSQGVDKIKRKIIRRDYSLGSIKKRTIIPQNANHQIEVQNFRRDLKTALSSQNTRQYMRNNNFSDKDKLKKEDEKKLSVAATQRSSLNRTSSANTFIPQRINQAENSLIFENMACDKKFYQTFNQWNRKGLMRKQKFNQFFDINELKLRAKLKKSPFLAQENKENLNKNTFQLHKDSQQINKINYENFKRISTGLKNKSCTLDKIRSQCSTRNHKFNFEKQSNETLQETLKKLAQFENDRSKQFRPMNRRTKNYIDQRNSKNIQNPRLSKNLNRQKGLLDKDDANLDSGQSISFQRHVQYLMPFQEDEDFKQGEYAVNILRNDNSHNHNDEEGKKLEFFAQTRLGFKKFDNTNNLQKYKADYRKFLKTQTLDRVKQIS